MMGIGKIVDSYEDALKRLKNQKDDLQFKYDELADKAEHFDKRARVIIAGAFILETVKVVALIKIAKKLK